MIKFTLNMRHRGITYKNLAFKISNTIQYINIYITFIIKKKNNYLFINIIKLKFM